MLLLVLEDFTAGSINGLVLEVVGHEELAPSSVIVNALTLIWSDSWKVGDRDPCEGHGKDVPNKFWNFGWKPAGMDSIRVPTAWDEWLPVLDANWLDLFLGEEGTLVELESDMAVVDSSFWEDEKWSLVLLSGSILDNLSGLTTLLGPIDEDRIDHLEDCGKKVAALELLLHDGCETPGVANDEWIDKGTMVGSKDSGLWITLAVNLNPKLTACHECKASTDTKTLEAEALSEVFVKTELVNHNPEEEDENEEEQEESNSENSPNWAKEEEEANHLEDAVVKLVVSLGPGLEPLIVGNLLEFGLLAVDSRIWERNTREHSDM